MAIKSLGLLKEETPELRKFRACYNFYIFFRLNNQFSVTKIRLLVFFSTREYSFSLPCLEMSSHRQLTRLHFSLLPLFLILNWVWNIQSSPVIVNAAPSMWGSEDHTVYELGTFLIKGSVENYPHSRRYHTMTPPRRRMTSSVSETSSPTYHSVWSRNGKESTQVIKESSSADNLTNELGVLFTNTTRRSYSNSQKYLVSTQLNSFLYVTNFRSFIKYK